jgi:S1-C subfamily serine protease
MASVFKAYQPSLQRYVAVKILPPHLAQNTEFSKRFEREARAIAQLDHQNIVPVFDYGQSEGITYIVMKHVDGGTLKDLLERQGKLPLERAALILSQIASALDYAHGQGVIHRDIKPANVLMARPDWALLSDFGLVHVAEGSIKLTGTGVSLGTPEYMSPEQAQGMEVDHRSDIYSLGVMLYATVTGQAPYTGSTPVAVILKHVNEPLPSPRAVNPALPEAAEAAIVSALAKNPSDRPATAGDFSRAFSQAVGAQIETQPPRPAATAIGDRPRSATVIDERSKAATAVGERPPVAGWPPQAAPGARPRWPLIAGAGIVAVIALILGVALGGRGGPPSATPAATATTSAVSAPTPAGDGRLSLPFQSTVQIWALQQEGDELVRTWSGSGSIITSDGLILTNAHVVLPDKVYGDVDALEVWLTFEQDQPPVPTFRAETVVADADLDIAVIKIVADIDGDPVDPVTLNLPAVPLGDSDALSLGDQLYILGFPGIGGENITLTNGRVAGFTNEPAVKGRAFIKTDATIAGGNSGGLASDEIGRLVGIPTQLGYGGDDQYVDCRVLADTNGDGVVNAADGCVPTGGFINALRPIKLALPLIQQAKAGIVSVPTLEPVREAIPTPVNAGEVLFTDDFSDESSGWGTSADGNAVQQYQNGRLLIEVIAKDYNGWSTAGLDYDDVDVEVSAQRLGGPLDNEMGIILRYVDAENFYVFTISNDGFYEFRKRLNGEWIFIVPWTATDLIDTQADVHRMAVVAGGDRFTFYIDGVRVDEAFDTEFQSGDIGLLAGSFSEGGVQIGFDDILVRVPGGARQSSDLTPTTDTDVILTDPFDDASGGWYAESSDDVLRDIAGGELTIEVVTPNFSGWSDLADLSLSDVIVEVDARKVSGPDLNAFGVMCRYLDSDNFYALEIGSDGTYAIYRYVGGDYASLVSWTPSDAIATETSSNRLRAECVGNRLRLSVNDAIVADVTDDSLSGGTLALIVESFDEGGVAVAFDNAVVAVPATAGGNVLFADDFSSPDSGWDRASDEDSSTDYEDGRYVIGITTTDLFAWANPGLAFGDAVIDVDATQIDGPDNNDFGVICRYQDVDNYHRILISSDGYYAVFRRVDDESTPLIDWTRSSAIKQGAALNHLTVTCAGNRIALSVNGQFVAETFDDTFSDGDIGLTAGAFDEAGVQIAFDNLVVTGP